MRCYPEADPPNFGKGWKLVTGMLKLNDEQPSSSTGAR
jgi:hypothetical protein